MRADGGGFYFRMGTLDKRAPDGDAKQARRASAAAANCQRAVELLLRQGWRQWIGGRNVLHARLTVTDRRLPRGLDCRGSRRRLRIGAVGDRGQGESTSNERHQTHDRPHRLNGFR
jgi:hypothetical protein